MAQQTIMRLLHVDINEWVRDKFKASSTGAALLLVAQAYFFLSYAAVYTLHMPRVLLYGDDLLNCIIFVLAICQRRRVSKSANIILWVMFLYCYMSTIGGILSGEEISILMWGYRNIIRFFMFFYSCIIFLTKSDFMVVVRIVRILFWVSVPLCTFERFGVTYSPGSIVGDMIGGIFWNFSGSNLPLNFILCVYLIDICSRYFDHRCSSWLFIATSIAGIYMAATAELKVYLFELVVIILFTTFGKGVSWRSLLAILLGGLFLSSASMYFIAINAGNSSTYADSYSLQGYIDYATRDSGYDGTGDLNRFTGIGIVSDQIFHNNPLSLLFGVGLGNADYSNFFTSSFYSQYSNIHYQWFHAIWMFIETGYVGIALYIVIFVLVFIKTFRSVGDNYITVLVRTVCILSIVVFFYNITLRVEPTGYLVMMILSLPYLLDSKNNIQYSRRKI